jgi:hypothetical protein
MGAVTRARDFQHDGHTQFATGLGKGLRIAAPIGVIEIHREEMAAVIRQQRIG